MSQTSQLQSAPSSEERAEAILGPYLGVLGGMGPLAGAAFMARLTALTKADVDQDHIPAILWSDPRVPDRTDAVLHGGPSPFPALLNGVTKLRQAGAEAIVIPCNSAHRWHFELQERMDIPVLHIVHAVLSSLRESGMRSGRIGLMGGTPVLQSQFYQQPLEDKGYECIVPHADELDHYCMKPIELVKANRVEEAFPIAIECIELLRGRGAEAIVLGCTEYPIALPHARRNEIAIPLVDSLDALALAAIEWYQSRVKAAAA